MSNEVSSRGLRERLTDGAEERLGRALTDLLENPLLTGAIGKAFDARERAAQAQEVAMGALNIPSAADIERLTRRLRSVSQRLEGIEDGVHRVDRALSTATVESRLKGIEEQLRTVTKQLGDLRENLPGQPASVSLDQERLPMGAEIAGSQRVPKPKKTASKRSSSPSRRASKG
ncbi:MAG TPA: hypothetical protein VID48_06010 [Solirubrobacteraceae bacterium]|jgi:hypothetical protein